MVWFPCWTCKWFHDDMILTWFDRNSWLLTYWLSFGMCAVLNKSVGWFPLQAGAIVRVCLVNAIILQSPRRGASQIMVFGSAGKGDFCTFKLKVVYSIYYIYGLRNWIPKSSVWWTCMPLHTAYSSPLHIVFLFIVYKIQIISKLEILLLFLYH